jgi:GH24 family phage-related lysozyme (muramidase)
LGTFSMQSSTVTRAIKASSWSECGQVGGFRGKPPLGQGFG